MTANCGRDVECVSSWTNLTSINGYFANNDTFYPNEAYVDEKSRAIFVVSIVFLAVSLVLFFNAFREFLISYGCFENKPYNSEKTMPTYGTMYA